MMIERARYAKLITLAAILIALPWAAAADNDNPRIHVDRWWMLGPVASPLPAFDAEGESHTGASDLLAYEHLSIRDLAPAGGTKVHEIGGGSLAWTETAADTNGVLLPAGEALAQVVYLATYLTLPRWMKIDVEARSTQPFELSIDASSVITKKKGATMEDRESGTAKLELGKHLLVVKSVYVPGDSASDWRLDVRVRAAKDFMVAPELSLSPEHPMTIDDVLDGPSVGGVHVSPDGEYVALEMSKREPPEGTTQRWVEIRKTKDGALVRTLADMTNASGWEWAPDGHRLSYRTTDEGKGTIRVIDLESGAVETLVSDVEDLSSFGWSPTGGFLVYSVDKEADKSKTGVYRYRGLYDRRPYERNRTYLYVASVPAGMTRRLTSGEYDASILDIRPDGGALLVERTWEDVSDRPYSESHLVSIDLGTQAADTIWTGPWMGSASYSPDGKKILVTAGPSSFGEKGRNVPEGTIPNDYDSQAYIFDAATGAVEPITKDFDPSVISAYWSKNGREAYILAEDRVYRRFYRYDVRKGTFKAIDTGADMIHSRDVARDKALAIAVVSSANHPWQVERIDLGGGKPRLVCNPSAERFRHVALGQVESWDFTTSAGTKIIGRIHYPPGFDPEEKWPCIVYYYGGTLPVERSFGGRYPKNLWAANGYVVYVLQPSGATGFGQEFSSRHVNDWGKRVSGEIIEGVGKFLEAHDFIDAGRVGCIGASFGGFMTELLVTRTDIFAAAISHAGISSISSYWGEGYWGYGYNSVSAANSFPWNRPDIYVDQSPLFAADKVTTPLLLLHGSADTNVPRGESDQMYAALKLLGKEVEYISVLGQNHWIIDYKKRVVWSNAIVAWFDRWLKDEPEWWNDMYPPLDE